MNIEHEYYEATGNYQPFEGICLVDTFDSGEKKEFPFFVKENTARVERQQSSPIFVIIGNPPYNAGQVNENDNNKNRKYEEIDKRVSKTYGKASRATLLRKLNDPYIKAIRWATDRIGGEGIVAFVTNNSFTHDITFASSRVEAIKIWVKSYNGNKWDWDETPEIEGFPEDLGNDIDCLVMKDSIVEIHAICREVSKNFNFRIVESIQRNNNLLSFYFSDNYIINI